MAILKSVYALPMRLAHPIGPISCLLVLCLFSGAQAGAIGIECRKPFVWEGAAVNAVILPYVNMSEDREPLTRAAEELTLLVQMNVLFSMLKYSGVGATVLSVRDVPAEMLETECSAETVMDKLVGKVAGARAQVPPGKGVVLIWGYLYEEGSDIFIQSYIRFLRRDVNDRLVLQVDTPSNAPLTFSGRMPDQAFAFAPRRVSVDELKQIGHAFRKSALVRRDPNIDSKGYEIDLNPDIPFQYRVMEARNGWMRIEAYAHTGPSGWVHAQSSLGDVPMGRRLPELFFVEGAVGYLRFRVHLDGIDDHPYVDRMRGYAQRAFARYAKYSAQAQSPEAGAMANILSGSLDILGGKPLEAADANEKFTAAAQAIPYSAAARNLSAISSIYVGSQSNWAVVKPAEISRKLLDSLALDAGNKDILTNMEKFYRLIKPLPPATRQMQPTEIDRKLAAVQRVLGSLEKQ